MGSTRFRIPPALSSVLAALGTLQLRAVGILNRVDPLVSASNLYIGSSTHAPYNYFSVHYDYEGDERMFAIFAGASAWPE